MVAAETPAAQLPLRIHIIGGPGSGKTWLARELHRATGLPHFELDLVAGDGQPPQFLPPRSIGERRAALHEIAVTPAWITEGSCALWTEELLAAADRVVWLDVRRPEAIRRVLRRHLAGYLSEFRSAEGPAGLLRTACHPHLKWLGAFVRYTWRYYDLNSGGQQPTEEEECSRASAAYVLAPLAAKTLHYRRAPDLHAIIRQLTTTTVR